MKFSSGKDYRKLHYYSGQPQHESPRAALKNSKFKTQNSEFALDNKGFTMIEIAVVMVILGVVFMSVLKIESMVKNAKIRQVISQYYELRTAILIYKDKYGYLPGDDKYAVSHLGLTGASASHNGTGDQRLTFLGTFSGVKLAEYAFVPEHLSKAGLLKGNFPGTVGSDPYFPEPPCLHAFNGRVLIIYDKYTGVPAKEGNCIRFDNLPSDAAQAIDIALDDGNPGTGFVRGFQLSAGYDRIAHNYSDPGDNSLGLMIFFE